MRQHLLRGRLQGARNEMWFLTLLSAPRLAKQVPRGNAAISSVQRPSLSRAVLFDFGPLDHHHKSFAAHCIDTITRSTSGNYAMMMLEQSHVWWPGLDRDIEHMVCSCYIYQTAVPGKPARPIHSWTYPTRMWQRVHVDCVLKDGVNLLLVTDAYSRWVEASHMGLMISDGKAQHTVCSL